MNQKLYQPIQIEGSSCLKNKLWEDCSINYPKIFKDWEKIFFNDFVSSESESSSISSDAIGMNLLSINPDLIIIDEKQKPLINLLKKHKIESCPLPMRHAKTLGGGFHCVTLDLKRK